MNAKADFIKQNLKCVLCVLNAPTPCMAIKPANISLVTEDV